MLRFAAEQQLFIQTWLNLIKPGTINKTVD